MGAASYRRAVAGIFGRFGQARSSWDDTRDNIGGNLHNPLATPLSGKACAVAVPLDCHDLAIGPPVGDPVAGIGTVVWWADSRDRAWPRVRGPQIPYRRLDGTPSENHEVEPDLLVPSDPAAWAREHDPQLDDAVHALLPDGCTTGQSRWASHA